MLVRDTADHVALEQAGHPGAEAAPGLREAFAAATWRRRRLRACSQAGMVNNLNDGLAWGIVPLFLAANGATLGEVGAVAGLYPAVWALAQLPTGALSDHLGRRPLIVAGMLTQAAALAALAASGGGVVAAGASAVGLGLGTAMAYPTLIAAVSDAVTPRARAPVVGVYRFWRDTGYVAGALLAGSSADAFGYAAAIALLAAQTALSGVLAAVDLPPAVAVASTGATR